MSLSSRSLSVLAERRNGKGGQVYDPAGFRRLRLVEPKTAGYLVERATYVKNRTIEVDVSPLQA
jgi:Uma2 family endonuclease